MKKQLLLSLLILNYFTLTQSSSLTDTVFIVKNSICSLWQCLKMNIDKQDYNVIREAAFKKMGTDFAHDFNIKYPLPTQKSVEELALCFDYNPSFWFYSNPPQTTARIGGKNVEIRGTIGNILYDFLVTNAHKNPKVQALPCPKNSNGKITVDPVTNRE